MGGVCDWGLRSRLRVLSSDRRNEVLDIGSAVVSLFGISRSKKRPGRLALFPELRDLPGKGWTSQPTPGGRVNFCAFARPTSRQALRVWIRRVDTERDVQSFLIRASAPRLKDPRIVVGDVRVMPDVVVPEAGSTSAFQLEMTGPTRQPEEGIVKREIREVRCAVGLLVIAVNAAGPTETWTWAEVIDIAQALATRLVQHPELQPLSPIHPEDFDMWSSDSAVREWKLDLDAPVSE
jgi:hypothetical protein